MKGEIIGAIFFTLVCSALLFFTGCKITQDVQRSKAEKYYRNNPDDFAQLAAEKYPPYVTRVDTSYLIINGSRGELSSEALSFLKEGNRAANSVYLGDTSHSFTTEQGSLSSSSGYVRISYYEDRLTRAEKLIGLFLQRGPDTIREIREYRTADTKTLAALDASEKENAALKFRVDEISKSEDDWKVKARKRNWALIIIASITGLSFVGWLVSKFKTINIKK